MTYSLERSICLLGLLAFSQFVVSNPVSAQPVQFVNYQKKQTIDLTDCSMEPLEKAKVATDRPGVLSEMKLEEGDHVQKGQLIAKLRDNVARAIVKTAQKQTEDEIELRLAKKTSEVALAELEQAKQANAGPGLSPITRYELRRLNLSAEQTVLQIEQAENELAILKLQLEEAKERLDEHLVKSPIEGMVTRRFLTSGESVQQGSEIAEITNFKKLKVIGYINVIDAFGIKVGDPVIVRLENQRLSAKINDTTFNGKIRFIDGAVTAVDQKVRIWAEVDNSKLLLMPGLRATMQIRPLVRTANQ